jgi:hypothetical protein
MRLAAIERRLTEAGTLVRRGGSFDRWDLEIRDGPLGSARLLISVEELGGGAQLVRHRCWPLLRRVTTGSVAGLTAVSAAAVAGGATVVAAVAAAVALLLAGLALAECGAALGGLVATAPAGLGGLPGRRDRSRAPDPEPSPEGPP